MHLDLMLIRSALVELGRNISQEGGDVRVKPADVFVPPSHARALDLNATIVEGIRGAGKSFWWSVLNSKEHRDFVRLASPSAALREQTFVTQGFGAALTPAMAPSPDAVAEIIAKFAPRNLWKAFIAAHAEFPPPFPQTSERLGALWYSRVEWVASNPEIYDQLLWRADEKLGGDGNYRLIMFDALDRLSSSWSTIRGLVRELLQLSLELRSSKNIRAKVFLRPDMLEDPQITGFADFSKLNATKASLHWRRQDLYGLLFQRVGNSEIAGGDFRRWTEEQSRSAWKSEQHGWVLPEPLARDEDIQERIFVHIAGAAMGKGPSGIKRGKPYSWLVNHLVDGRAQVSPRSFLSAISKAAEETPESSPTVVSPRAIQEGVQQASKIRVNELVQEDYPWIDNLMSPLRGLTVPSPVEDISRAWEESGVLVSLQGGSGMSREVKLPPRNLDAGARGVLSDLEELGLLQRLADGRVQMPDVYRIAFGLGRRGGVKPLV